MKQVQISKELFDNLIEYFLNFAEYDDIRLETLERDIILALQEKSEKMTNRQLYTAYKTAVVGSDEREQARKKYLDQRGVFEDFRTDTEIHEK